MAGSRGLLKTAEVHVVNAAKRRWIDTFASPLVWFNSATPRDELAALIRALRPVAPVHDLIRIGPAGDGGYLMPDDLTGITACVSPGVSVQVGFDDDIANRGIDVYMADGSVDGPPVAHDRFHFTRKFLDIYESDTTVTLDGFCGQIPGDGDWLLQMDIEGAEYGVLAAATDATIARFRYMVVEFHDLELLFARASFRTMAAVFRRLLRTHRVVHIHPNNYSAVVRRGDLRIPKGMEFTFARLDRVDTNRLPPPFPHPLDRDNTGKYPPVVLPACWRA